MKPIKIYIKNFVWQAVVPTADMMYQSGRISGRVRSLCDVFDLHPMLSLKSLKDSKIACTGIFADA